MNAEIFAFTPEKLKSFFKVSKKLQSVLGTVRKIASVTTLEEVLIGLRIYICAKHLFDPYNPFRISCHDDELSSVFGVANFTLQEMREILQTLIKPVDKCSANSFPEAAKTISDSSAKRTLNESEETARKKKCSTCYVPACTSNKHSPMVLYIPTSPIRYDTSDTAESVQGYETAYVKDSTDEDVWSTGSETEYIIAKERVFDVEYVCDSDNGSGVDSGSKSDEEDALSAAIITFMCRSDSDVEFWADRSSEEDTELLRSDMWKCEACQSYNKPLRRSCLRCWNERPNWLPENEKKLKEQKAFLRRKRQRSILGHNMHKRYRHSSVGTQEFLSSQEIVNADCSEKNILCVVCQKKPANASIVHSRFAHQVACYKCGKKLKKNKQRCPVCKRTIDKVVYQVSAF